MTRRKLLPTGGAWTAPPPPWVDGERGDAWSIARRREWAAHILEDAFRRGFRVAVRLERAETGADVLYVSPRGMSVLHVPEPGKVARTTESPAPYLIADHLAHWVVTRWPVDRLTIDGGNGLWYALPMTPGNRRVDRRLSPASGVSGS